MSTDYTDPATIDVDVVVSNINHAHRMRALVGGRSAAPTREQAVTQFGHPFVLVTTEHNDQTDESVVDTSLPIVDVPPDTELVLVPAAILSQSVAPTSQQFEQALHEAGLSATASELATRVVLGLLSRSAAEPPRNGDLVERVGCLTVEGEVLRGHFGACDEAGHRPLWVADVAGGVAAEPNEETGDG